MLLDEWAEREAEGRINDLLLIAPAGSYRNWEGELLKHLAPDTFKRVFSYVWQSGASSRGTTEKKRLAAFLACRSRPRIFVVNVEALSSAAGAKEACLAFLACPARRSMMAIDESTVIRNDRALRTKQVMALKAFADLRRILTGLVSPRSPRDLYTQFEFLDWRILGHESIVTFKRRYCVLESTQVPVGKDEDGKTKWRRIETIVAYRNLEELQKKIEPYSYRVLKKDCLDLPPKIYQRRDVALTDQQKQLYNDLVLFSTAELSSLAHVTTNMVITKLLRLHQIVCGHVVDEEGNEHDVDSNRISGIMDLLSDHSGKAIIWSNYRREVDKIVAALEEEYGEGSVAQFHGGNTKTRLKDEGRFLNDSNCRFMISTQSSGGRGNTWVNANLVVYFSNSYDLEMRMQSEDRCHRDGLKHSVTYVDLVSPRTVDEKILKALRKKLDMTTLISGEAWRDWVV